MMKKMKMMADAKTPSSSRRVWCRQWIANHDSQGAYHSLVIEMYDDNVAFSNYFRMRQALFEDLLLNIEPQIKRRDADTTSKKHTGLVGSFRQ